MNVVPCNKCTICCQNDAVRLLPHEAASLKWKMEPHPYYPGEFMLAHNYPSRDCVYLDASNGCAIHGHAPSRCEEMDCRRIAKSMTREKARQMECIPIWIRGRELLNQR